MEPRVPQKLFGRLEALAVVPVTVTLTEVAPATGPATEDGRAPLSPARGAAPEDFTPFPFKRSALHGRDGSGQDRAETTSGVALR